MDSSETTRQQVSDLVDGEADPESLPALLARLRDGDGRQAWALYHQIGDALRSVDPAPAISPDFEARFAARLAAEPVVLAPRRRLRARLACWPTTLAALAAAGFGFFVAPTLMRDAGPALPIGAPVGAPIATAPALAPASAPASSAAPALSAAAAAPAPELQSAAAGSDDTLAYITLHHSAHSSLYGGLPALRPAVLDNTPSHR